MSPLSLSPLVESAARGGRRVTRRVARRPPPARPPRGDRRPRLRLLALAAVAALAFVTGVLVGRDPGGSERALVADFAAAWARADYDRMHALLAPSAQARTSRARLERTYERAARTLTLREVRPGRPGRPRDGVVALPVQMRTRVFGTVSGTLAVPVIEEATTRGIDWRAALVFPGLERGESLSRRTTVPPRAPILARDGTPLATRDGRLTELGTLAADFTGRLGPVPPERRDELAGQGVPADALVGISGLQRTYDTRLTGVPGGTLLAGSRIVARAEPVAARPLRASIDPEVQRAASRALGGRYGGVTALDPATGELLALAGAAATAPQPPGSVFKIITLAAALEAGTAKPSDTFPVQTSATLEGVELANAHGEACGGTLRQAFADSCNSVFAPLGAELGARRLVAAAERFGFNGPPPFTGAGRSTLPPAREIGDDLAVGSTAIGQGKVLATTVAMASVAGAIANGGRLRAPTALRGERGPARRVTSAGVARTVRSQMRTVVKSGTGTAAAVPGLAVAGKTGTAELRTTVPVAPPDTDPGLPPPPDDPTDTDAWFAGFAPVRKARVAVAVLLVGAGAGGSSAAPVAREVLAAGG
jgi:hypothetical protein